MNKREAITMLRCNEDIIMHLFFFFFHLKSIGDDRHSEMCKVRDAAVEFAKRGHVTSELEMSNICRSSTITAATQVPVKISRVSVCVAIVSAEPSANL